MNEEPIPAFGPERNFAIALLSGNWKWAKQKAGGIPSPRPDGREEAYLTRYPMRLSQQGQPFYPNLEYIDGEPDENLVRVYVCTIEYERVPDYCGDNGACFALMAEFRAMHSRVEIREPMLVGVPQGSTSYVSITVYRPDYQVFGAFSLNPDRETALRDAITAAAVKALRAQQTKR